MTQHWKIGGVQLELREDGTFSIYQPDSNKVMSKESAFAVAEQIRDAVILKPRQWEKDHAEDMKDEAYAKAYQEELTRLAEVKAEAVLSDTEKEADTNAVETSRGLDLQTLVDEAQEQGLRLEALESIKRGVADVEQGRVDTIPDGVITTTEGPVTPKPAPAKRKPGRPRKNPA